MKLTSGRQVVGGPYAPIWKKRSHKWVYDSRSYATFEGAEAAAKSAANRCQCTTWVLRLAGGTFVISRSPSESASFTWEEAVKEVLAGQAVVAWITPKGLVLFFPGLEEVSALKNVSPELTKTFLDEMEECGADLAIIQGIDGMAATDPHWDGERMLRCDNPDCPYPVHPTDENCHNCFFKEVTAAQTGAAKSIG